MSKKTRETTSVVWKILLLGFVYVVGAGAMMIAAQSVAGLLRNPPASTEHMADAALVVMGSPWGFLVGWWSDRLTRRGAWAGLATGAILAALAPFAIPPLRSPLGPHPSPGPLDYCAITCDATKLSGWLLAVVLLLLPPTLGAMAATSRRLRKAREAQEAGPG